MLRIEFMHRDITTFLSPRCLIRPLSSSNNRHFVDQDYFRSRYDLMLLSFSLPSSLLSPVFHAWGSFHFSAQSHLFLPESSRFLPYRLCLRLEGITFPVQNDNSGAKQSAGTCQCRLLISWLAFKWLLIINNKLHSSCSLFCERWAH